MPQPTQIVPFYRHPHIHTVINDNTSFQDEVAKIPEGTRSIFVIRSPKGRDHEFYTVAKRTDFLEEYGVPLFSEHGQPAFNAYAFLGNRLIKAHILRVTADDAAYANSIIVAKVKPDATEGKLTVVITAVTLDDLNTREEALARINALRDDTPDADGFLTFPILGQIMQGRGLYGNAFRTRIVRDFASDADNDFLNYRLEVNEYQDQLVTRNAYLGSLYEDALQYKKSIFLSDKAEDDDKSQAWFYIPQEHLEDLYNLYIETVNPDVRIPYEQFDFLYGIDRERNAIPGYVIDSTHDDHVALDSVEGVNLANGHDGSFDLATPVAQREAAIENAYTKAFRGETVPAIKSKRRLPQDVFFDANYPDNVKLEINAWLVGRYDAIGYLDAGIQTNWDYIRFWAEDGYPMGSEVVVREFQHYKTRCPFTQKRITVTYPYFLATELPHHWDVRGNQVAFVGDDSQLYGHIKNSLLPVVDYDDLDIKEFLYENRVNYVQSIKENVYQRGTQSTSLVGKVNKVSWSDLNEENYVHVMLEIKRALEEKIATMNYVFAEPEDRKRFTLEADILMEPFRGVKVRSVDVYFDMTPFEEQRSILHCYCAIVFKTMAKRHILEIDINPRV